MGSVIPEQTLQMILFSDFRVEMRIPEDGKKIAGCDKQRGDQMQEPVTADIVPGILYGIAGDLKVFFALGNAF